MKVAIQALVDFNLVICFDTSISIVQLYVKGNVVRFPLVKRTTVLRDIIILNLKVLITCRLVNNIRA